MTKAMGNEEQQLAWRLFVECVLPGLMWRVIGQWVDTSDA